jgi:hypothetical protein
MEVRSVRSDSDQSGEAVLLMSSSTQVGESPTALFKRLLADMRYDYPQLNDIHLSSIPLPLSKLEDWNHWLAAEMINQWRRLPAEGISVAGVIAEFGLLKVKGDTIPLLEMLDQGEQGISISAELALRVAEIRHRHSQWQLFHPDLQQWLNQEVETLSKWFSELPIPYSAQNSLGGCLAQLRVHAASMQAKVRPRLQEILLPLQRAGSYSALAFLKDLGEALTRRYEEYETQLEHCFKQENSAWRAFNSLSAQLQPRTFMSKRQPVDIEVVLRALFKAHRFKLEVEMYTQACQIVGGLRQQIHLYAAEIVQADALLVRMKSEFLVDRTHEPIFGPVLKKYLATRIDGLKLLRGIERLVGCPLNQWGKLRSGQQAVVQRQVLAHLRPLCLEVYARGYAELANVNLAQLATLEAEGEAMQSSERRTLPVRNPNA